MITWRHFMSDMNGDGDSYGHGERIWILLSLPGMRSTSLFLLSTAFTYLCWLLGFLQMGFPFSFDHHSGMVLRGS